ncbi:MAG: hypothetical protein R3Y64_08250 [Peptostreptococcaceae bacterium]
MSRKNRKKLKRLKKEELLELMLEIAKENEILREKLLDIQKELNMQTLTILEQGSITEVSIKVKGVLDIVENSTLRYIENEQKKKLFNK